MPFAFKLYIPFLLFSKAGCFPFSYFFPFFSILPLFQETWSFISSMPLPGQVSWLSSFCYSKPYLCDGTGGPFSANLQGYWEDQRRWWVSTVNHNKPCKCEVCLPFLSLLPSSGCFECPAKPPCSCPSQGIRDSMCTIGTACFSVSDSVDL